MERSCSSTAALQLGSPVASEAWFELPMFRLGALGLVASSHLALFCFHREWVDLLQSPFLDDPWWRVGW